jgi:hypothetical protein
LILVSLRSSRNKRCVSIYVLTGTKSTN